MALALGTMAGIGGYTFIYAKGGSYLRDDPRACANCHVMQDHFDGWIKASLGACLLAYRSAISTVVGYGAFSAVVIGNLLYFRLAGDRRRMHEALAMVGYLGGLAVFGVSGIILGPALFAITTAVLEVWRWPANGEEALPVVAMNATPAKAPHAPSREAANSMLALSDSGRRRVMRAEKASSEPTCGPGAGASSTKTRDGSWPARRTST